MKTNRFFLAACAAFIVATSQGQTTGGGQAAGAAAPPTSAAGQGAAGVNANSGTASGTASGQAVQPNSGVNTLPGGLQSREQLPPGLQNREQLPPGLSAGVSNQIGIGMSNQVGTGSNQIIFSNRFTFGTNRFGTNRFGTNFAGTNFGTNLFGRTNRFGTNEFGFRTNRFRTNEFGLTNQFALSNELSISNSIELSNELGFVPLDTGAGLVPGGGSVAVGGGNTPAPAANQPAQPTPTPAPTGNPGENRVFGAINTNRTGIALQDRSVTEGDRVLLQRLRQLVIPRIDTMGGVGSAVHFWVHDGIVTVVGTVPSTDLRSDTLHMIQDLPGVNSIEDRLFVGNLDPNASDVDQELVYRLRESVLPQLAPAGKSSPVDFSARDGVVTLIGRVPTWEDAARVQKLVQQVPGVDQVRNQLLISNSTGTSTNTETTVSTRPVQSDTNLPPTGRQPTSGPDSSGQTPNSAQPGTSPPQK